MIPTVEDLMAFCEAETQKLIAELQEQRFANQGDFNGHEKWVDNDDDPYRRTMSVQKDKGRNQPLVDSGELKKELTTAANWDLKTKNNNGTIKLTMPTRESFTDPKYDVLDTGGKVNPYTSRRGNYINLHYVPPRPFKDLSDEDAEWVVNKLIQSIKGYFA